MKNFITVKSFGFLSVTAVILALHTYEAAIISKSSFKAVPGKRYECRINGDRVDCIKADIPTVLGNVYNCRLNDDNVPVCAKVES